MGVPKVAVVIKIEKIVTLKSGNCCWSNNFRIVLNILKEFKNFIMRGNVIDLAVAVIVGGAFNKY